MKLNSAGWQERHKTGPLTTSVHLLKDFDYNRVCLISKHQGEPQF